MNPPSTSAPGAHPLPRRFGKSLFLDTLKELFEGNQALFKGLAAENTWDWSKKYPVIRISFGGGVLGSVSDLGQSLHQQLTLLEQSFGLKPQFPDHRSRFKELIAHVANLEVQAALNDSLLQSLTGNQSMPGPYISRLYDLLMAQDFTGLKTLFHAFYASIANDWYRKNELSGFEGYYVSVFYSYFAALGLDIRLEEATNQGRIDMTVLFNHQVFLFEFKVVELNPAGQALPQIKDKGYADKFKARGEPIHLIGVEFSKATRNIVGFEVETLQVV